jgi:hypothetical protein
MIHLTCSCPITILDKEIHNGYDKPLRYHPV